MALLQTLLLLSTASAALASADMFNKRFNGDGTYYGYQTRGFGHCSFHFHGFGDSQGYPGVPLAINNAQYKGTSVCGMCVKFRGTGSGAGGNPITSSFQDGFICDECPECKYGDLDLQKGGDGRWKIEWYPVQCPVGDSKLRYGFQNGNPWYRKIMVANARVPIGDVKIWNNYNGAWQGLKKTIDNYWEYHGDVGKDFAGCAKLTITSIFGDTVQDKLCCNSGTCTGGAQFPCRADIGGGANCGRSGSNPAPANVLGIRTGGAASRVAASKVQAPSATYIQAGNQCGGAKFNCAAFGKDQCKDKPFAKARCAKGLKCVRNDAKYWACKK